MASIIAGKLGVQMETAPTTPLTFLHIFYLIFERAAIELNMQEFFETSMIFQDLVSRLEMLACEASCASMRASELALVLICTHMDEQITKKYGSDNVQVQGIVDYAIQLQQLCKVSDIFFCCCFFSVFKYISLLVMDHDSSSNSTDQLLTRVVIFLFPDPRNNLFPYA